jgi:hypothetical protein
MVHATSNPYLKDSRLVLRSLKCGVAQILKPKVVAGRTTRYGHRLSAIRRGAHCVVSDELECWTGSRGGDTPYVLASTVRGLGGSHFLTASSASATSEV